MCRDLVVEVAVERGCVEQLRLLHIQAWQPGNWLHLNKSQRRVPLYANIQLARLSLGWLSDRRAREISNFSEASLHMLGSGVVAQLPT